MPRVKNWRDWAAVFSILVLLFACGGSEQEVLRKFFTATRLEDTNLVAAVSVVAFPGESVESWEVVEVRPTTSEPFKLAELRREAATAKEARDAQYARFSEFRLANYDDLLRIEEQLEKDPDHQFKGRMAELNTEYQGFREERRELELELREIKQATEDEKKPARKSLLTSDEIDRFDGEVLTLEVLINVEAPDGAATPYLFTLRKYNLTNTENNFTPPSRWIIIQIQEQTT
jgi:hypothetical protein